MKVPAPLSPAALAWARGYDGYERLADTRDELEHLLRGARDSFKSSGCVPDWCGLDLLRGWAFYLSEEVADGTRDDLAAEWAAVVGLLPDYPDTEVAGRGTDRLSVAAALPSSFSTRPKMHKVSDFLMAKQERLREAHVASINQFVDEIRAEIAAEVAPVSLSASDVYVPYVDPDSGGSAARVLFVLESPARKAALRGDQGSGMLSADNNDETAKNMWEAYEATRMPRSYGLHWNAVPWFVGTGTKNAGVTQTQIARGREYLLRLLDLAPAVQVVVAFGKPAQASVQGITGQLSARGIRVIDSIHPGPQNYASATRDAKVRVHQAFREALDELKGDIS